MSSKILNFKSGHIDNLPDWFQIPEMGLKVICGPGDYVHFKPTLNRFMTNVEQYIDYDIFVCFGDEGVHEQASYTSVEENERYLIDHELNKLICLIDIGNEEQMNNFIKLFGDKVIHINRQDHHSPIFEMNDSFKLLKVGGIMHIKSPTGNLVLPIAEKKARAIKMYNHYGLKCEFADFKEPTTERMYKDSFICTKKDYSNNLFGGSKRRTTKRKYIKRRNQRCRQTARR